MQADLAAKTKSLKPKVINAPLVISHQKPMKHNIYYETFNILLVFCFLRTGSIIPDLKLNLNGRYGGITYLLKPPVCQEFQNRLLLFLTGHLA